MQFASFISFVLATTSLAAQASWSQLYPPVAPPVRSEATFGMHESLGKAILLWGSEISGPATTAWVLTGNAWSLYPGSVPPYRNEPAIAFDAVRNELVVFGGNNPGTSLLDDTWRWNGTQWTQSQVATRPPARLGAARFNRARRIATGGT